MAESSHRIDQTVCRPDKGLTSGTVLDTIKELKNDFATMGIRTQNFWGNDALFLNGLIAYNLLNCIRRLMLLRALRTARIKRLGLLLLHLPANVVLSTYFRHPC